MPADDFFFSLEFSSQGAPAALLEQLSSQLLAHVGLKAADLPELPSVLQKAVSAGQAAGQRRIDLMFRVSGGKLEVVVTANGGRLWQTTHAIP